MCIQNQPGIRVETHPCFLAHPQKRDVRLVNDGANQHLSRVDNPHVTHAGTELIAFLDLAPVAAAPDRFHDHGAVHRSGHQHFVHISLRVLEFQFRLRKSKLRLFQEGGV